jgi:hypothetical protein
LTWRKSARALLRQIVVEAFRFGGLYEKLLLVKK